MEDAVLKDSFSKSEEPSVESYQPKHPVGRFLWSAALGDPFVTWFFHRKELKTAPKSFFWAMTIVYLILFIPSFILSCLLDYHEKESSTMIYLIPGVIYGIATMFIQGIVGAKIMKKTAPNYEASSFKNNERCAIWFMLALAIGEFVSYVSSESDVNLPITFFDIPYFVESIFWKLI